MSHVFARHCRIAPPRVARGAGVYLYDTDGKAYLDALGRGGGVVPGPWRPATVIAALQGAGGNSVAYAHSGFFTSEPAERAGRQV
jgi:adenosylmethionine-8-amino-7-oxononanoate aminotransferase